MLCQHFAIVYVAEVFPVSPFIKALLNCQGPQADTAAYTKPLLLLCNALGLCSPYSHKSLLLPLFGALSLVFQQILIELLIYSMDASRCGFHAAVYQSHLAQCILPLPQKL